MTPPDAYVPKEAGAPLCPCGKPLVFDIEPGYEFNEWRAYCPDHGWVHPDSAIFKTE